MSVKPTKINASELPGLIQERLGSHYYLYEIEDVLEGLCDVLRDCLMDNCEIKLKNLGTFRPKPGFERKFTSGLTGETYTRKTNVSVIFRPDVGFIRELNPENNIDD